jgi:hypothetical protein
MPEGDSEEEVSENSMGSHDQSSTSSMLANPTLALRTNYATAIVVTGEIPDQAIQSGAKWKCGWPPYQIPGISATGLTGLGFPSGHLTAMPGPVHDGEIMDARE